MYNSICYMCFELALKSQEGDPVSVYLVVILVH